MGYTRLCVLSHALKNRFESCSFLMHLARNHTLFTAILACFCTKKEVILHPARLSYTLSYTRKRLQIQDVWGMGVGNVGFYSKTFFVERGREKVHIVPEVTKHRTSLGKSTDVLHRKYGCLPQRSPMFLFSGRGSGQRFPYIGRRILTLSYEGS